MKLMEHVMNILERVIECSVGKIEKIDNMQFGFVTGRSRRDAVLIVRQLQRRYLARKKDLWMGSVNL